MALTIANTSHSHTEIMDLKYLGTETKDTKGHLKKSLKQQHTQFMAFLGAMKSWKLLTKCNPLARDQVDGKTSQCPIHPILAQWLSVSPNRPAQFLPTYL